MPLEKVFDPIVRCVSTESQRLAFTVSSSADKIKYLESGKYSKKSEATKTFEVQNGVS